ncbi:MAG: MBL fold metallo-hydrolase [Magnetococcales bacterium]|nr:MBL fold metallo-hydrolase [Magnetococcales bacterium]
MKSDYHNLPFGITCIDTHYLRPRMAAAYLLVENGKAAFVETGPLLAAERMMTGLTKAGLKPQDVDAVIVTHVHLDHAGGAGELMRLCPNAKLYVHKSGARHLIDPTKLKAGAMAVYGEEQFKTSLGDIVAVDQDRVVATEDGQTVVIGDRELVMLDTPGHARHHFVIWDEKSRGVFSGDAFGLSYREFDGGSMPFIFPATTPVQLDPEQFHNSFDRIGELNPETIYLTHFGPIPYSDQLLKSLHSQLDSYLEMAKAAQNCTKDAHEELLASLDKHMRGILLNINSPASSELVEQLLYSDRETNAQGLEVWLARLAKNSK